MLNKIIEISLKNRTATIILMLFFLGFGIRSLIYLNVDAFPDTTPVQVQINTVSSALNAIEIEQQITLPLELSISGIPGLNNVRSISKFGLSQVVATFGDSTHIYDARQFILERISSVKLPKGIDRPQLGPISSGLGEVFHYIVRSKNSTHTLEEIRTIHDWIIKPELRKVAGVAEVNSWGGFERQYQVTVSPEALVKHRLTMDDVFKALEENNHNVGGGQVVTSGQALLVHGIGRVTTISQIEKIVVTAYKGTPVYINDIADVSVGHNIRQGAVTSSGESEVVLGLGFMLMGENSKIVTENLKKKLDMVRMSLPDDIILETVYDRTELVTKVIQTVTHNLLIGAFLVIVVLFLLLGNLQAGIIVALTIPFALLFAFWGMYSLSIAATLLSLGAMDFGIIVDGSVVMTENNMRRLAEEHVRLGRPLTKSERFVIILSSAKEVVRPIVFGMGIILIVFIPILSLEGIEGKLFKPMAWTFIFAMAGALLIAVIISPIFSYYFLPRKINEKEGWLEHFLKKYYIYFLSKVLKAKLLLYASVSVILAVAAYLGLGLGGEFVPKLNEGAIVINTIRLAGVSIDEAADYNMKIEKLLLESFPDEIRHVWSRIGTAEIATDPMGIELTDIFISLYPSDDWQKASTQKELLGKMEDVIDDLPGINMVFTQPIEMRLNEMVSGIRSDIGIKIFGDDFDELVRLSDEIQKILLSIPGVADLAGDQVAGQPILQLNINQDKIARHGIPARNVLDVIEAVGGRQIGDIFEGQRRFPLVVRLPENLRTDPELLSQTMIPTKSGQIFPLQSLAHIKEVEGPASISREWGRRLIKIQCNVRKRDVVSFVEDAQNRIRHEVNLPEGYVVEWGGQFEHLKRTKQRFMIVIPITLALIFLLLYFSLGKIRDVLIIYSGIPFAAIGGIIALYVREIPFSVSAAIGFIALSGIAVLNGQVLIATIRNMQKSGLEYKKSVISASSQRLRAVLATAITDAVGFLPMAISTGVGAEVQQPLATVVIGGIFTSTILTLFVLPALVSTFEQNKTKIGPI